MAKSFINSFLCVVVVFLLVFHASGTAIDDVCNKTKDRGFCQRVLGSDPRTRGANFHMLAQIALDLASTSASATKPKIHNLLLAAKDPNFRARFGMCERYYADALDVLRIANDDMKRGSFDDLLIFANGAQDDAISCEYQFTKPKTGPVLQSPLTNDNNNMNNLCDILGAVALILEK